MFHLDFLKLGLKVLKTQRSQGLLDIKKKKTLSSIALNDCE